MSTATPPRSSLKRRRSSPSSSSQNSILQYLQADDDKDTSTQPLEEDDQVMAVQHPTTDAERLAVAHQHLRAKFGYSSLRPFQHQAVLAALRGEDSLVLQSTGSGKSICFQLPALVSGKPTLVISPLISLMEDQVHALCRQGVPACHLSDDASGVKFMGCLMGECKVIYLTPEKAASFGSALQDLDRAMVSLLKLPKGERGIGLIAIDEAHCVSRWGHDFRPHFRELARLREALPGVPVMALTATATTQVRDDIAESLRLRPGSLRLVGGFDRPNLSYSVFCKKGALELDLSNVFSDEKRASFEGVAIVYTPTRKETEQVANHLRRLNWRARAYHAGMSSALRTDTQQAFLRNELQVLVATTAFGMGIDKADIRLVVHYGICGTIEGYYQQTGRAGRDGLPSECIMFYSGKDINTRRFLARNNAGNGEHTQHRMMLLDSMVRYAETTECRRKVLLKYFDDPAYLHVECPEGGCDNCTARRNGTFVAVEVVKPATLALEAVAELQGSVGPKLVSALLMGSKSKQAQQFRLSSYKTYGKGAGYKRAYWKSLFRALESAGYLMSGQNSRGYATLMTTVQGREVLRVRPSSIKLELPPDLKANVFGGRGLSTKRRATEALPSHWGDAERSLFESLKQLRLQVSTREGCPAYMVFPTHTLIDMVAKRPTTPEHFLYVEGVGNLKRDKYGQEWTTHIASQCSRLGLSANLKKSAAPSSSSSSSSTSSASPSSAVTSAITSDNTRIISTPTHSYEVSHLSSPSSPYRAWKKRKKTVQQPMLITYHQFVTEGRSVADISEARSIKARSVWTHLFDTANLQDDINDKEHPLIKMWPRLGISESVYKQICGAAQECGDTHLKPIKLELPEEISYDQIRFALLRRWFESKGMVVVAGAQHAAAAAARAMAE